jgi:SNF2 family DNA or RNA helicase
MPLQIELDENDFFTKPYPYQIDGVNHGFNQFHNIKRPEGSELNSAIFDDMGIGKTKQAIDIACIAWRNNLIDGVIVVCPKSVRGNWDNENYGQITRHASNDFGAIRFDQSFKNTSLPHEKGVMLWITISYSYLRTKLNTFKKLIEKDGRRFLLIFDESSYIKGNKTQQTVASRTIRKLPNVKGCILLNGTPIANNRLDLWAQFDILDPVAIDNIGYYHFRARYAIPVKTPSHEFWTDFKQEKLDEDRAKLEELNSLPTLTGKQSQFRDNLRLSIENQERVKESLERLLNKLKPWIIRREKKDVLTQLPKKLPPVFLEAQLSTEEYKIYRDMREEMVAWASKAEYSEAVNGAVKLGRLSQITSGFLGGIKIIPVTDELDDGTIDSWVHEEEILPLDGQGDGPREIGTAKLDTFLEWYQFNPNLKVVIWCRFRAEMFRLERELRAQGKRVGMIIGAQKDITREEVIRAARAGELDVVIAHPRAGGWGVDGLQNHFHTAVYMSMSHSLIEFLQSGDRLDRIGQTEPISTIIILATTPKGGKTVDHLIVEAVTEKDNISKWTMQTWKQKIKNI